MKQKKVFFETGKVNDYLQYVKDKKNKKEQLFDNGEENGTKGRNNIKNK